MRCGKVDLPESLFDKPLLHPFLQKLSWLQLFHGREAIPVSPGANIKSKYFKESFKETKSGMAKATHPVSAAHLVDRS